MIKMVFAATLAVIFTFTTPALAQFSYTPTSRDHVGLYLGTQIWQIEPTGILGGENTLIDFNLKKEQQISVFIDIKQPISSLPNVRVSNTQLDTSGQTTLTRQFYFKDKTFAVGDKVDAGFNVSYVDYTLYYALFDSEDFSFELGITARDLNGDVTVARTTKISHDPCNDPNPAPDDPCIDQGNNAISSGKIRTDDIHPMLFVATSVGLPLTQLNVFAQADFSLRNDNALSDYQVGFSYDLSKIIRLPLNVTAGYRVVNIEFENLNSLYTDLEFNGAFVGMVAHF